MRKTWATIELGTVDLQKGSYDLTLTGLKKTGVKMIDVKGIEMARGQ